LRSIIKDELSTHGNALFESVDLRRDGTRVAVEISNARMGDAGLALSIVRDITERKQAEQALRESEKRYRQLLSSVTDYIYTVNVQDGHPVSTVHGPGCVAVTGYAPEDYAADLGLWYRMVYEPDRDMVIEQSTKLLAGETVPPLEHRILHRDGSLRWVRNTRVPRYDLQQRLIAYDGLITDITERKQVEEELQQTNDLLRAVIEAAPTAIIGLDLEGKVQLVWNTAAEKLLGWSAREAMGKFLPSVPVDKEQEFQRFREAIQAGKTLNGVEVRRQRRDGTFIDYSIYGSPIHNPDGQIIGNVAVLVDITERKHHELEREAVIKVSNTLRKAVTRTEILTIILDQLVELFDAEGAMLALPNSAIGGLTIEMGRGAVGKRFTGVNIPPGRGISTRVIESKQPYLNNHANTDPHFYRSELLADSHCTAAVPLIAKERAIGALWVTRRTDLTQQDLRLFNAIADIAANALHRVTLHEQTELQLHRLIALHQIDLAISTSFDLGATLNVILNHVRNKLEVDAASILLLNPIVHTLDYAAGTGFRTRAIEQSNVTLRDEGAGRAAREGHIVSYPDVRLMRAVFNRAALLIEEGFISYYACPLMVKGQVKGVLELFHRETLESEQEWISYFETLATQAAIAIESTSLFENLQKSNTELMLAYDATIEGWSRALDLRDRETEGHTQRVTEMVLELADKMGVSDAEKVDLRRGALLHDIGKMGVPDSILLKSGPLSEDEWEVMRQHPAYAYQMLSPISYLKHALEIPYCHHEKWDGSGYPRRLAGEEIPLSARMFAVVDVFDALTHNRPYRAAWPLEIVQRYIEEQAGKHFDPRVVAIFLETR
jgi:PAS domain S-box-containing protein